MTSTKQPELPKIKDSEDPHAYHEKYGFIVKNGKYIFIKQLQKGKQTEVDLSNFTMRSMFHLVNGSNNSQRIIYLQRNTGETHIIEVYSSEMKSESFETILKSKRCTFYGSADYLKRVFGQMMDEEDEAFILSEIGWNPEHQVYVFANAVFSMANVLLKTNEIGIVNDKEKQYYLPAFGFANLQNEDFKTERLYKYLEGSTDFEKWSKLYNEAFGDNGVVGILFLILALFRDIVFDNVGFFPFLFLFGDYATGKTSFTDKILSLFGKDTIGTPLNNATVIALSRLTSSKTNGIFYFKEYTNETDIAAEDFILTAYDGAGRTTGVKSNDNRTKSHPVKSALIFDGNHLPTAKSAILSRMILLKFEKQKFLSEEKNAFKELTNLSNQGFGKVLTNILSCREIFSKNFKSVFSERAEKIKDSATNLPDRLINHMALLFTAYLSLKDNLGFSFDEDKILDIIGKITEDQFELLKESNAINIFWTAIDFQIKRGFIHGYNLGLKNEKTANYRIKIESSSEYILQIKLQSVYPYYTKYCKDNNLRLLDYSSLKMLLTSSTNQTFLPSNQKSRGIAFTDKIFGSCYQFMLTKKEENYFVDENELSV